ncbi:hypothetical protein ACFLZC_02040 [Patescibacteria group bacterium]
MLNIFALIVIALVWIVADKLVATDTGFEQPKLEDGFGAWFFWKVPSYVAGILTGLLIARPI